ncbi:MAG: ECF transporter S component [Eggerthellales bacterium]|nr:ECF transporter S component [Eggerthellales bacterium]
MSNANNTANMQNTNRWDTHQLVVMALMCAIGVLLSFVEFAIFPAAAWLKYDASFVPSMICGFAYGAGPGMAVGLVGVVLHGLMSGNFWGAVMNAIVVCGYVIPAALVYKRMHTWKGAIIGLVLSFVAAIALAIVGNLLVTPIYAGMPMEAVAGMIVPILLPFNIMKAALNSIITLVIYKAISNLITPKKDQVKGR